MDINQLYHDHQLTLMRAENAHDKSVRAAHEDDAAQIARRIERSLRLRQAPAAHGWKEPNRSADQSASS
jgi:hypothetical protein